MTVKGFQPSQLRRLRRKQQITQEQLAVLCGLHPGTVNRYESGDLIPQPTTLAAIARVLHAPISDFVQIRHFKATVADYRAWAGMSQQNAAKAARMSVPTWGGIERAAREPTAAQWAAIARALDQPERRLVAAWKRTRAKRLNLTP